jgi:ferredoxin
VARSGGERGGKGFGVTDRLHIDWTRCDGRGLCIELLPELLDTDDWGYPLSRTGEPAPVVPVDLRRHADRAVTECPRLALRIRS